MIIYETQDSPVNGSFLVAFCNLLYFQCYKVALVMKILTNYIHNINVLDIKIIDLSEKLEKI